VFCTRTRLLSLNPIDLMKVTFAKGSRVELPNWLVVVLAVLLVSLIVPVVDILAGALL